MALIVQKFGGSSVGTLDRIRHVANKIVQTKKQGHQLVIVVSAMYGETDRLINLAKALTPTPDLREYDVLISTGEQVSMALLSMALNQAGCPARSFTGSQVSILTDDQHSKARICDINSSKIKEELKRDNIVIVAGFQGISPIGDITTLGRGGSDTTAVALAAALKADECQIFTDVAGIYTTDPHLLPEARLLPQISFEEMMEMSSQGAKVLQMRSVELASKHLMPMRVLSTFADGEGTLVTFANQIEEKRAIAGIAVNKETALIYLNDIQSDANTIKHVEQTFQQANIHIEIASQHANNSENLNLILSLSRQDLSKALKVTEHLSKELNIANTQSNNKAVRISVVGSGISASQQTIQTSLQTALQDAKIESIVTTSSNLKLCFIVHETHLTTGVRAIHQALGLDKPQQQPLKPATV